mmetsp:Transcript_109871/g.190132  ORF Transcript_109871/g.190132 Transcript_109871/m.190132 type:complete len:273 (+) Transcript_109871:68-886(+)
MEPQHLEEAPADVGSNDAENKGEQQVVYLTGYNATGKTTMGQYIADTHNEWHCVDGDEFVDNDPELKKKLVEGVGQVIHLMRGTFEDYLSGGILIEEVKKHDADVRAATEPFLRAVFEKLKQIPKSKIVFAYHVWRQWVVDVFREYFPTSTFVEVQVTRSLLLDRYVSRMAKRGTNLEAVWRDGEGPISMLREKYGPEYKGNEQHIKKYVEWRYVYYRDPFWEEAHNSYVVNNANYDGAQALEKILNLATQAPADVSSNDADNKGEEKVVRG